MFVHVIRYASFKDDSLGFAMIDGRFICHTLEDEDRTKKVSGETRIPDGLYQLGVRHDSPKFKHFDDRWGWHNGMIWIKHVPNFTYVYVHPGNDDDDSDACLLTGDHVYRKSGKDAHKLGKSREAYKRFYCNIRPWLDLPGPLDPVIIRVSSYA